MLRSNTEFLQLALKAYDNPILSSIVDFDKDIKRFGYLNTMLARYLVDNDITKLRLTLNHLIIIMNIFGVATAVQLIRYKITENINEIETLMFFLKMINATEHELNFNLLNTLENL